MKTTMKIVQIKIVNSLRKMMTTTVILNHLNWWKLMIQMMNQMMAGGGGAGGMGGFPNAAPADTRPPRERYASELQQLKEMGFTDEETCLQILEQCGGNVNLAIERLFAAVGP